MVLISGGPLGGPPGGCAGRGAAVLEARGISKTYPGGFTALRGVDVALRRGEIHVILGENGAGKSTLLKILGGSLAPTGGEIYVEGRRRAFGHPREALRAGIAMAHQGGTLVPELSVEDNLRIASRSAGRSFEDVRSLVSEVLGEMGVGLRPAAPASSLSSGERQAVEVALAAALGERAVLLDEPTSLTGPSSASRLARVLRRLAGLGRGVAITTHKISEALMLGSSFAVLRGGTKVAELCAEEASPDLLLRLIFGEAPRPEGPDGRPRAPGPRGATVLRAEGLEVLSDEGIPVVRGATFEISRGEVVAVVSPEGGGGRELAEAVVGLRRPSRGRVVLAEGARAGYIPADNELALIPWMSVAMNAGLRLISRPSALGRPFLLRRALEALALEVVRESEARIPSLWSPVRALSGGNARRIAIWREILSGPDLLVAEHLSASLDFESARAARRAIRLAASRGSGVLVITGDPEEAVELGDRVCLLRDGLLLEAGGTRGADEIARELMGGAGLLGGSGA